MVRFQFFHHRQIVRAAPHAKGQTAFKGACKLS
jgi:hypothetical protein